MKKIFLYFTFVTIFSSSSFALTTGFPKDYYKMKATIQKQIYFFNYLYFHIDKANKAILEDREFLLFLQKKEKLTKEGKYFDKLSALAKKYKVENPFNLEKLLKRVDVVPPSMALAQAAVESGWGMSRFVKLGNNLFGHWTYGKKGIVPLKRNPNAKHLIRIFNSFEDSISSYMLNLNRTGAYKSFREKRAKIRSNNQNPKGLDLSQTMINYSEIKERYLTILKNVIKKNKLQKYDEIFYTNLEKE